MSQCKNHGKYKADTHTIAGIFCKECADQIKRAQSTVDRHVEPKECFIIYEDSKKGWLSFTEKDRKKNTGCAHWVAHQLNLKGYGTVCAEGYYIRVPDVVARARKIDRNTEEVKVNDIWASKDHTGIVVKVEEIKVVVKEDGKDVEKTKQKILIQHCSSGQGRVATDDFERHFKGRGDFYRL